MNRFALRYMCLLRKYGEAPQSNTMTCFIIDDTVLEKSGVRMEGISRVFDHVKGRCVLGYKLLLCAFFDGKTWNTMLGDMKNQYDILWQGDPVQARYIRLRRLDSDRKNWASIRSFVVVPAGAASLEFENSKADDRTQEEHRLLQP